MKIKSEMSLRATSRPSKVKPHRQQPDAKPSKRHRDLSTDQRQKLAELLDAGWSVEMLADLYLVTVAYVRMVLRKGR